MPDGVIYFRVAGGDILPVKLVDNGDETYSLGIAVSGDGVAHLGRVSRDVAIVPVTFSLDTSAYAAGDVLADTQSLADAMRTEGGTGELQSILLVDKDKQGIPLDVVILSANTSLGAENSPDSLSDGDSANILHFVSVYQSNWMTLSNCYVASLSNLQLPVKAQTGSTTLYAALVARGIGTFGATGITAQFGFARD